jgi:hypothetical protein
MNLLKMNRTELSALQGKLKVIGEVVGHLAQNGFDPLISLSSEASVITVDPVLSFGPVSELVLIEPAVAEFETPSPLRADDVAAVPEAKAPTPSGSVKSLDAPEFVAGPVTADEKRQIEDLHKQGLSNADIAKHLSRRPSIVGSHLYYLKRRTAEALSDAKDPKPAPSPEPARESVISLATAKPEEAPAATDPGDGDADYKGENLQIWQHIKRLGFPKGWDADLDLEMCEGFGRGMKTDRLAIELDVDSKLIRDRYAALTACIRDDRGHMSIVGQERLVKILRDRLKALRAATKAA